MLSHKTLFWTLLIVKVCSPIKQFNWSCQSLKTLEGNFKYPIDARNATEFDIVLQNKTVIARWIKNVGREFGKIWVKAVDSTSITLHQCHNLTLHKQYPQNDEESIYNMTADEKSYEPSTATPAEENENPDSFPPWRTAGIVCCSLVALTVLAALAYRKNGKNGLVNSESSLANFQNLENNNLKGDSQTEGAREPGQYFGEEEECKRPKKGNAEQTGAGMLEHGDCTNRDVVSGDAVEAHSPQGGKALRTLSVLWPHKDQWQRKERQYEELRWNREDTGGTAQQRGVGWDNDK